MQDDTPPPTQVINYPTPQSAGQATQESSAAALQAFKDALNSGVYGQYAQQQTDIQKAQAPQLSQSQLDNTKLFGPQIISATTDLLKQADPTRFQLQKSVEEKALSDLGLGGALSPEEERAARQDAASAYERKGIRTSVPAALGEVQQLNAARSAKEQQRLVNAQSVLSGQQANSIFAGANMGNNLAPAGTQNTSALLGQLSPSAQGILGYTQNMFGQQSQNVSAQNNLGVNQYQFGIKNASNPFLEGIGVASGVAGNIMGGMAMCWVAEEIFGKNDVKTLTVRAWGMKHLKDASKLGEFMRDYLERGRDWAQAVKEDFELQEKARVFWTNLYNLARKEITV
jgi:hypothetical protein